MHIFKKTETIVLTVLLFFFTLINQSNNSNTIAITKSNSKGLTIYDDFTVSDNFDYIDSNYEYDGFLNEVYEDCDLYHNTGTEISLEGKTYPKYGSMSFKTTFLCSGLSFDTYYTYCNQGYNEDVSCYLSSTGSLNAELNYYDASSYGEIKTYYIDDYKTPEKLERLVLQIEDTEEAEPTDLFIGLIIGAIIALVVSYVIIAEIAEQDQAEVNYAENKTLDGVNGVGFGCLIYDQHESDYDYHSPANYRFGFTTFDNVGCEVASAYNLMVMIDQAESLSETIYKFEKWGFEFSIGWGYLGSNPKEISHYLYHANLEYIKVNSNDYGVTYRSKAFDYFKSKAQTQKTIHLIISTWNSSRSEGLHTYYVKKTGNDDEPYLAYNWVAGRTTPFPIDNLDELIQEGQRFIVGYLIYEE